MPALAAPRMLEGDGAGRQSGISAPHGRETVNSQTGNDSDGDQVDKAEEEYITVPGEQQGTANCDDV